MNPSTTKKTIMKRLKYITVSLVAVFALSMCSEADEPTYSGPESVYFRMPAKDFDDSLIIDKDTITYTFAYYPELNEREIPVPIEVTGLAANHTRTYAVNVRAASGTLEGVDYRQVATTQTFAAGTMYDTLWVTFYRTAEMQTKVKKLEITIVGGGDLLPGVQENLLVELHVSDMLEKPVWWDTWRNGFGTWHPTKLREWIRIWGGKGDLPIASYVSIMSHSKEVMAIYKLRERFETEAFYDEESGARLTIPGNL